MLDKVFIFLQYIIPQHLLSRIIGFLAETEIVFLKNFLISIFINFFNVNMNEAKLENINDYKNFNAFFTRELKDGSRNIDASTNSIISPVDGQISQLGKIQNGKIIQAKGMYFTVDEILANSNHTFQDGYFSTIYLSPKDYHRIHMPLDGKLISMTHIPGDLFSVNISTSESVPNLFARNERVVCLFETEIGQMAVILVGAMIVASIETVFAGLVAPTGKKITNFNYQDKENIFLNKGEELGRFKLGSTVVILFEKEVDLQNNKVQESIQMGNILAKFQ